MVSAKSSMLRFPTRINPDLALAAATALILASLVLPLPSVGLDFLLALNLAVAATLLVTALFVRETLHLAAFPTMLLLGTLFRISLNVSTTRLALSEGEAGEVIAAFGEFVVRGDWVVGLVIFAILSLVQFLVVAKGAERVSEVAARFTLDALPGKQMAIDAEVRTGSLDPEGARKKRRELERESQLFGAMDGAMKFIKGDVIAGLMIVAVNLLGGTAIGIFKLGLSAGEAASRYALIAIGDGLVSQLASLCMTVAAGLIVTRVASEGEASLGAQIGEQLFGQYRSLWVVATLCGALAVVPGMPSSIFALLALALASGGWALKRRAEQRAGSPAQGKLEGQGSGEESGLPKVLPVGTCPLTLSLSSSWSEVAEGDGKLVSQTLEEVRSRLFAELGIRVPAFNVRLRDRALPEEGYALWIDDLPCGQGRVDPRGLFAIATPQVLSALGVVATESHHPSTGGRIGQIAADQRRVAELADIPVRSGEALLVEHVEALLRLRAADLLGIQDCRELLNELELSAPVLVQEALQKVPLPLMVDVFRRLLREGVGIRNLRAVLEALVSPSTEGDAEALAERCRQALHRQLSHRHAPGGTLYTYLVDPAVEQLLRAGTGMDPEQVARLLSQIDRLSGGRPMTLLSAPDVRRTLQRLCAGSLPQVSVLTYAELASELQVKPLGRLTAQA